MTPEEIKAIVSEAVKETLQSSGHVCRFGELNNEDVVFLRSLRNKANLVGNTVGVSVILAILGGVYFLVNLGLETWKK